MFDFNTIAMRRMLGNAKVYDEYKKRIDESNDFGRKALREVFDEIVSLDPNLVEQYSKYLEKEIEHVPYETPITQCIKTMIKIYGWKNFISDFALFARNKQYYLKRHGLTEAAEKWKKIDDRLRNLPKSPQL